MEQEEIDRLQAELDTYRNKRDDKASLVASVLTAGKRLGDKVIEYDLGNGAIIKIHPRTTREIKKRFIECMQNIDGDNAVESFIEFPYVCAELMADVCIDEELKDVEFWLGFDEVSGCLIKLAMSIFSDLYVSSSDVKNFRKK